MQCREFPLFETILFVVRNLFILTIATAYRFYQIERLCQIQTKTINKIIFLPLSGITKRHNHFANTQPGINYVKRRTVKAFTHWQFVTVSRKQIYDPVIKL